LLFLSLSGASQVVNAIPGGGFVGMELNHTHADMSRAILEGCAYEVRWALDGLRSAGIPVDELWLAGGANRSPVWPQILTNITGVPLAIAANTDWAAVGGAILAGWGIGAYPTLGEGIARFRPAAQRILPDPSLEELYAERMASYRRVTLALHATKSVSVNSSIS
jgi:sugar (pentulose or hexulose) kinase